MVALFFYQPPNHHHDEAKLQAAQKLRATEREEFDAMLKVPLVLLPPLKFQVPCNKNRKKIIAFLGLHAGFIEGR